MNCLLKGVALKWATARGTLSVPEKKKKPMSEAERGAATEQTSKD